MVNERDHALRYAHKFGQIAIQKGFVSEDQIREALTEQIALDAYRRLRPRKLIGEILFENGWITVHQIEQVLEQLSEEKHNYP